MNKIIAEKNNNIKSCAELMQNINFLRLYFVRSCNQVFRLPMIIAVSLTPSLSLADDMSDFANALNKNLEMNGYAVKVNSSDCRSMLGNIYCFVKGVRNINQIGLFSNPSRICFDNFDGFNVGYLVSNGTNIRSDCDDY